MDKETLIKELYKLGTIKFGCFLLKNGESSPIYLNVRSVISMPELVRNIANLMWHTINPCKFDVICGVPYSALPFATCLSLQHNIPLVIRRKEPKSYGTKQQIDGLHAEQLRCLVIEDVTTSGSSVIETINDINTYSGIVNDVVVLIDREQGAKEQLAQQNCNLHAVMTMTDILNVLSDDPDVSVFDQKIIKNLLNERQYGRKKLTFAKRAELSHNQLAQQVFNLMEEKQSNLVLSADLTSGKELLHLADMLGSEIAILKTHIDIIDDYSNTLIDELTSIANKKKFLIFEDRKFADIGNTVAHQYQDGIYKIINWADLVSVHSLPGKNSIGALNKVAKAYDKPRAIFLIADMSSKDNLLDEEYHNKTIAMATEYPDLVLGFIAQKKLSSTYPQWLYLRPGVHLHNDKDSLGQRYVTPRQAIIDCACDMIIVGRGIIEASDPLAAAKEYKIAAWQAYQNSLATT